MVGRSSSTAASFSTIEASVTILARTSSAERARQVEQGARLVLRLEEGVAPVELRLQPAHDVAPGAVQGELVRRGKEEALGAGTVDMQLLQERFIGRRVEPGAEWADVERLETFGDVEAGEPLGDRDADVPPAGRALEAREERPGATSRRSGTGEAPGATRRAPPVKRK